MKVDIIDENHLVIYLRKNKVSNINLKDELKIEETLKDLFVRLNNYYDIKIKGYYNVDIYVDKYYGVVFDIGKEELEYYDYYDNQVDMKIIVKKIPFVYQVEDYFNIKLNKFDVYKNCNNIYLLPKKKLTDMEMANLIENAIIIYKSDDIIKSSLKLNQ